MAGRIIDRNSLADAKRTAEYIAHRNMLIGRALQMKLTEDKAEAIMKELGIEEEDLFND